MYLQTDHLNRIKNYFAQYKPKKVYLFGSFARGTADKHSDIDLCIVTDTDTRFLKRWEEFPGILDIGEKHPVEVLVYTPEEFLKMAGEPFFDRIENEGTVLYEC